LDINTKTVDGKNTFHSLARAVIQFKSMDELAVCAECIKRGRDSYWWHYASLTDALSFTKPKSRVESPRRTNEFDKIKSCNNGKRTTVDNIRIINRLLSSPEMSSCFPSIMKSWPKQFVSVEDSCICYWKNGPMLLSSNYWCKTDRYCPQYLRI